MFDFILLLGRYDFLPSEVGIAYTEFPCHFKYGTFAITIRSTVGFESKAHFKIP